MVEMGHTCKPREKKIKGRVRNSKNRKHLEKRDIDKERAFSQNLIFTTN